MVFHKKIFAQELNLSRKQASRGVRKIIWYQDHNHNAIKILGSFSRSDVYIVDFEQISHIVVVFLLLTLSKYMPTGKVV